MSLTMQKDRFLALDLNLLRTFWVLSQELNTSRAARRLQVSQPAVSRSLGRLREHFNDELFVKTQNGLQPTAKGELLSQGLPPLMAGLADYINHYNEFEISKVSGRLVLAMHPFLSLSIGRRLFQKIHQYAPLLQVEIVSWSNSTSDKIKNDEVNIGLNYYPMKVSKEVYQQPIGRDTNLFYVRRDHPLQVERLALDDINHYDLVSLIINGWNEHQSKAEALAQQLGVRANVVFRTDMPKLALDTLLNSDMLMPGSSLLQDLCKDGFRTIAMPPEVPVKDTEFALFYHYRYRKSPYYQFIVDLIQQEFQQLQQDISLNNG